MVSESGLSNDLVAVLKDGSMFCKQALEKNTSHDQLFKEMISIRDETILKLAPLIEKDGKIVRLRGTFAGEIRRGLSELKALLQGDDKAYFRELKKLEEMTLEELRYCKEKSSSSELKLILNNLIPRFERNLEIIKTINSNL